MSWPLYRWRSGGRSARGERSFERGAVLLEGGQSCSKILQGESAQLLRQVLDPDEGGDGKDWGEDEYDSRENAEKFHERGARASRNTN